MKITFLLPYAGIAGGIRVVAIYAKFLAEHGHEVNIISVSRRSVSLKAAIKEWFSGKMLMPGKQVQGPSHLDTLGLYKWDVLKHNGPIRNEDVPDGDVIISTWWKTAEWLNNLSFTKGKKVYFCQGYETHGNFPKKRVEATYHLPFFQICVSPWVKEKIRQLTGKDDQEVVLNAVDSAQFYSEKRKKNKSPLFGFIYSSAHCKGTDILLEALSLAKKVDPSISSICFGVRPIDKSLQLPDWIEFHENPKQDLIRVIYSKCNAWLFGSREEGFGLPILEAMACRTPVIATPAGAAKDLITQKNGFLLSNGNAQEIADCILRVNKMSNEQWVLISDQAHKTAINNNWIQAASNFERALNRLVELEN